MKCLSRIIFISTILSSPAFSAEPQVIAIQQAQLSKIQARLADLESKLAAAETTNATQQKKIAALETSLSSTQDQLSAVMNGRHRFPTLSLQNGAVIGPDRGGFAFYSADTSDYLVWSSGSAMLQVWGNGGTAMKKALYP